MAEEDTWESRENLENAKELVEEFKKEYGKETKEVQWQEEKEDKKVFLRELLERFTAKMLWGWSNKEYERQREKRYEENWRWWKNSLEQGNLKRRLYYETTKKETISCTFVNLMGNIQEYNVGKI